MKYNSETYLKVEKNPYFYSSEPAPVDVVYKLYAWRQIPMTPGPTTQKLVRRTK